MWCVWDYILCTNFKNGLMSDSNREDVTDDALLAVLQHIMCMDEYNERGGFSGYEYKIGGSNINLVAYDKNKYKLVKNEVDNG